MLSTNNPQFPKLSKLWDKIKFVYNNVDYVGDKLKSDYELYSKTYRHLCRYYCKFNGRVPSNISDLEEIAQLRHNHSSAVVRVFLSENDFNVVNQLIELYNNLHNMHNCIMTQIMRLVARDHWRYLQQPQNQKRFNKILRCLHDTKLATSSMDQSTMNSFPRGDFTRGFHNKSYNSQRSESSLPPQEKIWYLYCLVERETLAVSTLLESIDSWEKNVMYNTLSLDNNQNWTLPSIKYFTKIPKKTKRLCKESTTPTDKSSKQLSWENNLRAYPKAISYSPTIFYNSCQELGHLQHCILDPIQGNRCTSQDDVIVNDTLKINKWNLREPQSSVRTIKPLCNKLANIKSKQCVSKPHGNIKRYQSKISSTVEPNIENLIDKMYVEIDPISGRGLSILDYSQQESTTQQSHIAKINEKLAFLENTVEQLIEDRADIQQRIINPLRQQMESGLDWLKSTYSVKSNILEQTQNHINQLKIEKSFIQKTNKA